MDYSNYTVLIVDDVPMNVTLAQISLRPYKFRVYTASDGREAFDVIAQHKPDIIILDLILTTKEEGFNVLAKLRSDPSTKDIRIIGYSALNTQEDIDAGLKAGLDGYLIKPLSQRALKNTIEEQLAAIGAVSAE